MGKQQGFKDPRGNVFFEISRIVEIKRPQIIFLENVKNLIEHENGKSFLIIYNTLAQFGYCLKYKVMNANEYGNTPQDRARIYIITFLDYGMCDKFAFPVPIDLTVRINDFIDRSQKHSDIYYYSKKNKYYRELSERVVDINAIYRIDDTGVAKRKYLLSPTLKANMGTYPDRVPIIKDDFGIRKLTPYECLALQGFPSDFKFSRIPLGEAYKQAGNTVCVPVVRRIADKIKG